MGASSLIQRVARKPHPAGGRILQTLDRWEICLHNRYPAYITWEEFVTNQAQLRANSLRYREERPGVARKGQALLQGIVRCGRCGALLHLHYSGPQGEFPEYRCSADQSQFGGTDCQRVRALALDTQVERRFLEALQPDQVTLALAALAHLEQEEQAENKQWELRLERARYQAKRAGQRFPRTLASRDHHQYGAQADGAPGDSRGHCG